MKYIVDVKARIKTRIIIEADDKWSAINAVARRVDKWLPYGSTSCVVSNKDAVDSAGRILLGQDAASTWTHDTFNPEDAP